MSYILGTFRFYNEYRSADGQWVKDFTWGDWARENFPKELDTHIAAIERCDDYGQCEPRCPNKLPIVSLLRGMLPRMRELREITKAW
jgi:predicted aldo/keto reductase-like oxidoreductase